MGKAASPTDTHHMRRALQLAEKGRGFVEPNPMVGCVIADGDAPLSEGWHLKFGDPHAEIEALNLAGENARGATMYVSLEPCCHQGKTPPCTEAIIRAGIKRVVIAQQDPFSKVAGGGIKQLREAGITVKVGVLQREAAWLNAPYIKRVTTGLPWVIAKWAMTLDGKIATRTGDSRWISNEKSRDLVHRLRGEVDAIVVGGGTVRTDNPLLTARPPGPRVATRIVINSHGSISSKSQLVQTAREYPLLIATGPHTTDHDRERLSDAGVEVFTASSNYHAELADDLLAELGHRGMTNILVEGGSHTLGTLFDMRAIDEVRVFIGPKLAGGVVSPSPVSGGGVALMAKALRVSGVKTEMLDDDLYIHGRIIHGEENSD